MNAELSYEQRDRMLRDAHQRWAHAQHHAERAFGPTEPEEITIEAEFAQSFDDADGVL